MKTDYTQGSILKALIRFSIPYLISCFLQTFYGLCDLFITGQYNGASAISAVSIGSQIMHMVTVVIVGLAMGTTVTISQYIGNKDRERAAKYIGQSTILFVILAIAFTFFLLMLRDPAIRLVSTPNEAVLETRQYISICFTGIPFIVAYNVISCIYRGLGDSKSPMVFVFIACIVNIFVDYLLIGSFKMGASGAAWGTILAQAVSVICSLAYMRIKGLGLSLKTKDLVPDRNAMKRILSIGFPVACQDGFIQIGFLFITAMANGRGLEISASVGIVEKVISFLFLVPSAILASVSSVAAQNIGAGFFDRAKGILHYALAIVIIYGIFVAVSMQFLAGNVLSLFTADPAVIHYGIEYLRTYCLDTIFAGIHFAFSGYFCANGRSGFSFLHNIIGLICVRIPGVYLTSVLFPATLVPMGLVTPFGSFVSGMICIIIYKLVKWENVKR